MQITEAEVAEAVRAWCAAFHTRDLKSLLAFEGGLAVSATGHWPGVTTWLQARGR